MNLTSIQPPLTGKLLMEAVLDIGNKRKAIVEGLLYEKTMIMVSSDPGLGKSTISAQLAVELATGLPVFNHFPITQPIKVFYIQSERSILELKERLKKISETYSINWDNLYITDEYQILDLMNFEHSRLFIDCIKRDCPLNSVIIIDPIYSTVSGGLKEDRTASAFTKVMSIIQKEISCILWYNHHNIKPQYTNKGDKWEKDDPFYGSGYLKYHVTGSYNMSKTEDGVKLHLKKDNYGILTKEINLEYDPETELCRVAYDKGSPADRLKEFLNAKKLSNTTFSFNDLIRGISVSTRCAREIICTAQFRDNVIVVSAYRNKYLYKVKPP